MNKGKPGITRMFLFACLFLAVLNQGGIYRHPGFAYDSQRDRINTISDINGNRVDIQKKGRASLLLFFDPQNTMHKGLLVYAQVLFNKFKGDKILIIGITPGDKRIESNLKRMITFPIIEDASRGLHKRFNIGACCGGTVLIDKNSKIKFNTATLVSRESMRQLVELEVLGEISYDFPVPRGQKQFIMNKRAPDIELRDVHSNRLTNFSTFRKKNIVVTFFSFLCSVCKSGKRVQTLIKLKEKLEKEKADLKVILVFFEPYNKQDIMEWEREKKMPFDKYICADIFTEEEKYITDESLKIDPLTVVLNGERRVVFLESLGMSEDQLMKEILKKVK